MTEIAKRRPYFSIITVCYNSEKTIDKTIEGVLNQKCQDFEYIIVDGASSDRTMDIVKSYDLLFEEIGAEYKYISEPDRGIYDAMNKGIRMSRGKLIGIVNSDDYYTNHALADMKEAADSNPQIGIFYGIIREFNEHGTVGYSGYSASMLPQKMIAHPTCFIRREIYMEKGLYDLSYRYASDYDYILRMKKCGVEFLMLESVISNFSLLGVSQTSNKAMMEGLLVRKKHHVGNGLILSLSYVKCVLEGLIKKIV
ncbi:MAG: glycosyltransferase [Lachnospiraceae bacterium]|nr:glycosyltransferase [Lachnospiraceae bacterium]